jgi:hypothetical protein
MIAKKADDDDDQYDHDFEAEEVCTTCGETQDNCEGHEDFDEEYEDSDVCAVCGNDRSDPVHGDG